MRTLRTSALLRTAGVIAASGLFLTGCSDAATDSAEAAAANAQETADTDAAGSGEPLDIMLTNDDGWDAPGITAAYEALTGAGHSVTLVAPAENQSGKGGAVDISGTLEVTQPTDDPQIHSVGGTPATAASFGLKEVMEEAPDLVVSGINAGANAGTDIRSSGTFGAASIASGSYGVPAIATSLDASSEDQADYEAAAQLLLDIIDQAAGSLEAGYVLNMNYPDPAEAPEDPQVVYAETAQGSGYVTTYERQDGDTYEVSLGYAEDAPESGDLAELSRGNVTLSLITTTPSLPAGEAGNVTALVDALN
ncbi:5'/3'-nucleotidase SurE [Brevibacterium album]|uniref:5'/3'-nucleotidase SurE n=1 Tax=Brevibacterium album TaxID=417948 RepID=UPI0003F60C10|nr:5'/3'-nucleotidase SurE [Brevibacterium album]